MAFQTVNNYNSYNDKLIIFALTGQENVTKELKRLPGLAECFVWKDQQPAPDPILDPVPGSTESGGYHASKLSFVIQFLGNF